MVMQRSMMTLAMVLVFALAAADQPEVLLQRAIVKQEVDGDLKAAIEQYRKLAQNSNKSVAARALVRLGECYEKQGNAEARRAYEQVISKFGDQTEAVARARAWLAAMVGTKASGSVSAIKLDDFPALSTSNDGRYVAYVDRTTEELGIRDVTTGEHRLLTHDSANGPKGYAEGGATFSPDGRQIAYLWYIYGSDERLELRLTSTDGSGQPRVIFRCNDQVTWLIPSGWTPDGKSILANLLIKGGVATGIATILIADGKVRELRTFDGGWSVSEPKISPDGAYIAYARAPRADSQQRAIMFLSTAGLRESLLVGGPANQPIWTADGKSLLISGADSQGKDSVIRYYIDPPRVEGASGAGCALEPQIDLAGWQDRLLSELGND